MNSADRDTQHSESATNELVNDAPCERMRCPLAIVASSSVEKSSIRISTMLGGLTADAAGRAAGAGDAARTDGERRQQGGGETERRQATAGEHRHPGTPEERLYFTVSRP